MNTLVHRFVNNDIDQAGCEKLKVWVKKSVVGYVRSCLKQRSRNLRAPLCSIFHPNSVTVARYGALIRVKSLANCDEHFAESLFQTGSKVYLCKRIRGKWGGVQLFQKQCARECLKNHSCNLYAFLCYIFIQIQSLCFTTATEFKLKFL